MLATYDELGIVSAALDKCPALQKPRPYGAAPTYHRAGAVAGVAHNDGPARTSTPTMAMMMMIMFIMTMIGMRKGRQADRQTGW